MNWDAVPGAVGYRVQLVDVATDEAAGDAVLARGTSAALPLGTLSIQRAGVLVDSWTSVDRDGKPASPARAAGFVSAGPDGGDGARWQIFAPEDFVAGALRARFAQLAPGERLAVLALNVAGNDGARAAFEVTGTADAAPGPAADSPGEPTALRGTALHAEPKSSLLHEEVREHDEAVLREALASGIPAARPDVSSLAAEQTTFCIVRGLDFGSRVRKSAVRALETEHAVFYVDSEDASHYPPGFFDTLGGLFEQRAYPADRLAFGEESDVDGNGM